MKLFFNDYFSGCGVNAYTYIIADFWKKMTTYMCMLKENKLYFIYSNVFFFQSFWQIRFRFSFPWFDISILCLIRFENFQLQVTFENFRIEPPKKTHKKRYIDIYFRHLIIIQFTIYYVIVYLDFSSITRLIELAVLQSFFFTHVYDLTVVGKSVKCEI